MLAQCFYHPSTDPNSWNFYTAGTIFAALPCSLYIINAYHLKCQQPGASSDSVFESIGSAMFLSEHVVFDAEKQELKQMDKKISIIWKKRMTVPDPYEVRLQKEKVD